MTATLFDLISTGKYSAICHYDNIYEHILQYK